MKLTKDFIDQIKDANPIEDIAQQLAEQYDLPIENRTGDIFMHHHHWVSSPDRGTALWVTSGNQGWSCFSCKQGGDVISLVQSFLYADEYEQRNYNQFIQAVSWLADRAGIPFQAPEEDDIELAELRIIYAIYGDFIDYCVKNSFSINNAQKTYRLIEQR